MLSKNHPIILFIDRNGFSVYQDILANIAKFNFTPDLVSNLDVVNERQLGKLLETFIQINKIISGNLAVILSDNIIYIKDLAIPVQKPVTAPDLKTDSSMDKEQKDEVQSFLENIPFEDVLARVIKAGNMNRIVAVNRGIVMTIVKAFVDKGSNIEAITPGFMYGQSVNFTMGLTPDNIRAILENTEILRLGNLLTDQEKIITFQNSEVKAEIPSENEKKKPRSIRQYILIGVFMILLVVLAVVYFASGNSQESPQVPNIKNTPVNSVSGSGVPVYPSAEVQTPAQATVTSVPVDLENIKIKIVQSSQTDEKAANLKNELSKIGFQDIVSEMPEVSVPEKSSVIFSQDIPAELRNSLIIEIKKILPDISALANQDSISAITILIGKS